MRKTESLTAKEIDCIAKRVKDHDGNIKYKFDLSRINVETFDSLMKAVPEKFLSQMYGIGFNCDLLVKTDRKNEQMMLENPRSNKTPVYPLTLQNSAAKRKRDMNKILVRSVCAALEQSEKLRFLSFRFIQFRYQDIETLSAAIYGSNSLRVLRFCGVPLGNKGLMRLCRALRKRSIIEIQLRNCGLTDECGYDLQSLLSFHVFVQSEAAWKDSVLGEPTETVCLQSLDLRDNEFTHKFIDIIADSLLDIPLKLLDLRGNSGLTQSMVKDLQKDVPNTKILTGISPLPKSKLPVFATYDASDKNRRAESRSSSSSHRRIQELENENQRLHALIDELQMGVNVCNLEPDLMIVGQRAQDFVEQISKLDELLAKSEHGPPPFLESTRKKIAQDVKALITPKKKKSDKSKTASKRTVTVTTGTSTALRTKRAKSPKPRRQSPRKTK